MRLLAVAPLAASLICLAACASGGARAPIGGDQTVPRLDVRERPPAPRRYLASRRAGAVTLDGRLDDSAWGRAGWSEAFTDIEGPIRPGPRFRTRVKMLWDDQYWYIGAQLEEPDLWATVRERDAVVFRDNDFELFVDPSGSTHRYYEVEMNQLGTVWDLFLPKPYREGGQADNGWNIAGLRIAVALAGTLNDPRDRDRGWTVEMAIPWAAFADSGRNVVPPRAGAQWRVNFSRVEWDVDTIRGGYVKRRDAAGKPLPEHNWVWSPQGAVNMHLPELWGVVQFGGATITRDVANDRMRWQLRRIYYAERLYRQAHGRFAGDLPLLGLSGLPVAVRLTATDSTWDASVPAGAATFAWHIRDDGLTWHD